MANETDYLQLVDNMLKDRKLSAEKRSTILQLIQQMAQLKQGKGMAYAADSGQPGVNLGYSQRAPGMPLSQPNQYPVPQQPGLDQLLNQRSDLDAMFQDRMKNSFPNGRW